MPWIACSIDGGVNTEAGPSAGFRPKGENIVSIPWLIEGQNIVYNLDGWPQKMPGASNVNSSATGASDHVNGIFDYWKSNTSGNPSQQRILYSGTQIYRESGGTLTSIKTGLESAKMPAFEVMNDDLVIATSSAIDVPMAWDQTTFANLGGSPPNFDFMVQHKDRMFAAGVDSNKSRLYYSVSANHEDWTGAGSGSIDVSVDDGDVITGLRSHKDELIIFKGPNAGSIYRLTGSSPTGSDAFALHRFVKGVGSTNHQAIILSRDDLWFWDDNGIHSLKATEVFGDYNAVFLSSQIASYVVDQLNHNRFDFIWGANFVGEGHALWTVSRAGSSTHDLVIGLDYRFEPFRFFFWPAYAVASLAMVRDTSRLTIPWAGNYAGRALRLNQSTRNIGGTSYTAKVLFPYVSFADPAFDATAMKGRIGFAPKGDTTFTAGWQRDGNTQQTTSVSQAGSAALGSSSDNFVLDTDVLGGGRFHNAFFDMGGMFKEIQIELNQGTVDVDFEPHSFSIEVEPAGVGTTMPPG